MATRTLYSYLQSQVEARPTEVAAVYEAPSEWRSYTWEEIGRQVRETALGLLTLDLKQGERVAIISRSRHEWAVADLAIGACAGITAAVLNRLKPESWALLLARSACRIVFVDTAETARDLLAQRALLPGIQKIVVFEQLVDEADPEEGSDAELSADQVIDLLELRRLGLAAQGGRQPLLARRLAGIRDDDVATLLYTAGTTEAIKAVSITHDGLVYEVEALAHLELLAADDLLLLCMPLAHAFARVFVGLWVRTGATIAFADSTRDLFDSIEIVQPTVLAAPSRVFEALYGTIVRSGQDARGTKSRMFAWAMKLARERMNRERDNLSPGQFGWPVAQKAVFERLAARLRKLFGGRVRRFICGGAPLADRVAYFFAYCGVALDMTYGLTEATGISCINTAGREKIGMVGPPLPGTEVRLADDGEILIRGRGLMKGYWSETEGGLEITEEGFLRTGDVGELDVDGYLAVRGRKDDLILMRDGRVIAPYQQEMALRTNAFIGHALVDGNGSGELVALISLDPETVQSWARARRLPYRTFTSLARSPELRRLMQGVIDDRNRRYDAAEAIKRFSIVDQPFAIGDELTATMRLRRERVREKYHVALDALHGHDDPGET